MNDQLARERQLRAEFAELRAELRQARLPPIGEAVLRAAFRAQQQRSAVAAPPRRVREWRPYLAAAAVLVVTIAAIVIELGRHSVEPPAIDVPAVVAAAAPETSAVTAFQPLLYAPGFSPSAAYSVVRVRIPLSSFAVVQGTALDGTIEADLLVGEDGIARGIRFNQADTLLVSDAAK
jgi:hypothetical protein